jgi:protein-S-isoprenylcysteine O-methyltransferase Ste14
MWNRKMKIGGILITVLAVGQIALAVMLYNPEANVTVINLGWGVLMLSAIFGWLPILTFRKRGEVEGKSYINTTVLVDKGVYSIVRHPQYLAGVLISIALPMITQHWLVAVLGAAAVVFYVLGTYDEEEGCLEKFGDAYIDYMKRVPRMNFLLGIFRLFPGKKKPDVE